jgi:hypothetical protein
MLLRLADVATTAEAALRRRRLVREAVAQVSLLALDAPVAVSLNRFLALLFDFIFILAMRAAEYSDSGGLCKSHGAAAHAT